MIVAVTGGRGFIGSKVCSILERDGHKPIALDLPNYDVRDQNFELPVGARAVIHLAGVLGTHELFDEVDRAITTNVAGTAHVLEACRKAHARYVGITMPKVFPSIYTATKLGAEALETAYHHTFGLPVSRVRAFNAFGPGQAYGPGHPQKIVPTFAVKSWAREPIPIWGDGTQTVDLIYVYDLAALLVDALKLGNNETVDGGTGVKLTVNEVAEAVNNYTGSKAGVVHLPMRRGEVPTQIVAEGEGWDRIGWMPRFHWTDLCDTVEAYKPWSK